VSFASRNGGPSQAHPESPILSRQAGKGAIASTIEAQTLPLT